MIYKTYELLCQLPAQRAVDQIAALFSKDGVKYKTTDLSIISLSTPIVLIGIQPRLYTHSNWVGINPFTFISGIDVHCESMGEAVAKVVIRINRLRAYLWVVFWAVCSFLAGRAMPEPGGAILFFGVVSAAWLVIVSFLCGYLVKKEIGDCLRADRTVSLVSDLQL